MNKETFTSDKLSEFARQISISPNERTVEVDAEEYTRKRTFTYEYRFDGETVLMRTLRDVVVDTTPGQNVRYIEDGVVLESEIKKLCENDPSKNFANLVAECTQSLAWRPVETPIMRYVIMSKHPELFSLKDLRRIMRTELERLKQVKKSAVDKAIGVGLLPTEDEFGILFSWPAHLPAKALDEDFFRSVGTNWEELKSINQFENDLHELLGDKRK